MSDIITVNQENRIDRMYYDVFFQKKCISFTKYGIIIKIRDLIQDQNDKNTHSYTNGGISVTVITKELENNPDKLCDITIKIKVDSSVKYTTEDRKKEKAKEEKNEEKVYAKETKTYVYLESFQIEANANYIFKYLSEKGWSKEAICGLFGNIEQEGNFNPGTWEVKKNGYGPGYGLVQWTPASKFFKHANLTEEIAKNLADKDPKKLMDLQLDFLIWSCKKNTPSDKREWFPTQSFGSPKKISFEDFTKSNQSPKILALVFHGSYERSKDTKEMQKEREESAIKWYNYFIKKQI